MKCLESLWNWRHVCDICLYYLDSKAFNTFIILEFWSWQWNTMDQSNYIISKKS